MSLELCVIGAGYVLSREAFNRIGHVLTNNRSLCSLTGVEDKDVAMCLRSVNVYPNKSIDELGRERFHPLNMTHYHYGQFPP